MSDPCVGSAASGTLGHQPRGGGATPTPALSMLHGGLLGDMRQPVATVYDFLKKRHYLGPAKRGWAWSSDHGVMVFANPSSRRLPQRRWCELIRWCLMGRPNDGSRQWALFVRWARRHLPAVTTLVSYSDPSAGHTGALYRASNWWWAPTWHRLRPPPTGNGKWIVDGEEEAPKDRWIYPLRPDAERIGLLTIQDDAILRRWPEARYREPGGVPFALLSRVVPVSASATRTGEPTHE